MEVRSPFSSCFRHNMMFLEADVAGQRQDGVICISLVFQRIVAKNRLTIAVYALSTHRRCWCRQLVGPPSVTVRFL